MSGVLCSEKGERTRPKIWDRQASFRRLVSQFFAEMKKYPQSMNSNNLLAVELKSEKDSRRRSFQKL
jgi:hypothetical protein